MVFSPDQFLTHTLREREWGINIANILAASINSVNPAAALSKYVKRQGNLLKVGSNIYNLENFKDIYVVGAGKAGAPMSHALAVVLGEYISYGFVIVKEGYTGEPNLESFPNIRLIEAGHPIPDERGVDGTNSIISLLKAAGEDDLVFCLISGGGSSLLTAPVEGIQIEELQELLKLLLASGATINEINSLRKHLDAIKGGRMAQIASPATMISLILSDVLGDPLDVIASGPTVADTSTFIDAYSVLERHGLTQIISESIVNYLNLGVNGGLGETPKPGDPIFENNQIIVIGNNQTAALSAIKEAQSFGFNTLLLSTYLQGEASQAGKFVASIARQLRTDHPPIKLPACIIIGGETTVKIKGEGKGGRNQELALGAVMDIRNLPNIALVTLATDGEDGPTDAAGAVITGETFQRAQEKKMDTFDYLERNDSYHYFSAIDELIKTGPTCTNVNDLTFLFSFEI